MEKGGFGMQDAWLSRMLRGLRFGLAAFVVSAACFRAGAEEAVSARNLILMIGDGMGVQQVRLAGDYAGRPLALVSLPVTGASETRSADHAVTDSAAAGTAIACGRKTHNGMLGQLPDGTALTSLAEHARAAGKRVGILSSVPINHATPAAFYAKAGSRNSYYDIGLQAIASKFDVLGGNGFLDAEGKNHTPPPDATLWQRSQAAGYSRVRTPDELRAVTPGHGPVILSPDSLYALAGMPHGRPFDPAKEITLAQMTAKALELLENPGGFFLMVEGGAIDWACHANDALGTIAETLAFDEAVAVAKAFAEATPGTLLVVTADHETGGLTLGDGYDAATARDALGRQTETRGDVLAWLCQHVDDPANRTAAGWDGARAYLAASLGVGDDALAGLRPRLEALAGADEKDRAQAADALARAAFAARDAVAGVAWTTGGHTAADVSVHAFGPGAERFAGTQDNTRIFVHGRALLLSAVE